MKLPDQPLLVRQLRKVEQEATHKYNLIKEKSALDKFQIPPAGTVDIMLDEILFSFIYQAETSDIIVQFWKKVNPLKEPDYMVLPDNHFPNLQVEYLACSVCAQLEGNLSHFDKNGFSRSYTSFSLYV